MSFGLSVGHPRHDRDRDMTLFIPLPGNERLAGRLARATGYATGRLAIRRLATREGYVRLETPVRDERVVLVCALAAPDEQILRLIFAAAAARAAGARRVELLAPYIAYMRDDGDPADGEAVSARTFAGLLSRQFDSVLTVDPHLQRIHDMTRVFEVPTRALSATPLLAAWVANHMPDAVILGPERASLQWVSQVAALGRLPYAVMSNPRPGDEDEPVSLPDMAFARGRRVVLVDDIISTGRSMLQAAAALRQAGFAPPVCLAVHALFADDTYKLLQSVCAQIVTTDTVDHPSNQIEIAPLFAGSFMAL